MLTPNDLGHRSEKGQQDTALDASQIQDAIRDAKIAYESTSNQHDILSGFDSETTHYASVSTNRTNHDNADLNVADGTEPPAYSEEATSSEKAKPKTGFSWGMSSIKQSLVALASSLQPKPGPFVSAMCQAASRGDVQQVAGFLAQGANINGLNEDSNTALTCAILANQESSVRLLMASGASLKSSNWSSLPPLFLAASVGSTDVAQLLLNRGARVDEASITGQPYFVDVVTAGNVDGIKFLLENGARANTAHISGRLVIAHAVSSGNPEVVKLLLKFGADVNSKDITGSSLLAMALEGKDPVMPELLLKMGANANSNTIAGISLLADQILRRRFNLAELLVMSGADPNALDWQRQPILLVVLKDVKIKREEKICIVRVLLTHGALTNASDPTWGRPAIYYAMKTGVAELVGLLLENGAKLKPTITMDSGESLLTYAINEGRNDLVKLLLEHGADPNKTGESDKTPLVSGLIKQDYELVKLLREAGADTSATEVRDFAESLGRPDIMRLLGLEDNVPAIPAREHGTSTPPPDYASSQK